MKPYQPFQFLNFIYLPDTKSGKIPYLKSDVKVWVNAGETLAQDQDERDPMKIVFKTIKDVSRKESGYFSKSILLNQLPAGPRMDFEIRVYVVKPDGSIGGQVTTTISGNAEIEDE